MPRVPWFVVFGIADARIGCSTFPHVCVRSFDQFQVCRGAAPVICYHGRHTLHHPPTPRSRLGGLAGRRGGEACGVNAVYRRVLLSYLHVEAARIRRTVSPAFCVSYLSSIQYRIQLSRKGSGHIHQQIIRASRTHHHDTPHKDTVQIRQIPFCLFWRLLIRCRGTGRVGGGWS